MPREPTEQRHADFRSLDAAKVIETIRRLHARISERFPDSGLSRVCGDLLSLAKDNAARAMTIAAPNLPLRLVVVVVLVVGGATLGWIGQLVWAFRRDVDNVFSVLQGIEAAANLAVLIAAAVFFLVQIERRLKRRQALPALHEMRSIVHVIDMHQLTKDPSAMTISATPSSPDRMLGRAETARYLDYCSEMLSLSAKVAVLFAQGFPDPDVIETVSDIERLATGLSQKIWQKIMIILTEIRDADASPVEASRR